MNDERMHSSKIQVIGGVTALVLAFTPITANARTSPPSTEAAPPEPQPEAEAPVEGPAPPAPSVETVAEPVVEPSKGPVLRKAGIGLLAAGGVLAVGGLSLTIAYTVRGDLREDLEDPVFADIERMNRISQMGGLVLVSGLAIVGIGGILFVKGKTSRPVAQLRFTPSLGGLVVSGRF